MQPKRLTGPGASVVKYDVLTALSVIGFHGSAKLQLSLARLIGLITARYNWRLDELSVGQRDMARFWNVTERTVKREVKAWQEQGLIICKRAGVRGRVAAYRLNFAEITRLSRPNWQAVGPDFEARMQEHGPSSNQRVVTVDFGARQTPAEPTAGLTGWGAVSRYLRETEPHLFENWIAPLRCVSQDDGVITLVSNSRFAAQYVSTHLQGLLEEAVLAQIGPGVRITLRVD